MYNQHVNSHCYYGVNHDLLAETSNQAQDYIVTASHKAYPYAPSTTYHAQQILASPLLEEQEEIGWHNQDSAYYQQQAPQLCHSFNALSCTLGHNNLTTPQELILFNLLQDQQQQHICYQDNQLTQRDGQDPPLNEWVLVDANQVDLNSINHSNGLLPLSPMSMSSADNFDSSPIMGDSASYSHRMYSQTNPSLPHHLSPSPAVAATAATVQSQYYHHHTLFNNSHPGMLASEATNNKGIQSQEIAQTHYQQQQQQGQGQVYQINEIKQEAYSTFDKQQQQLKQRKKTTRRRASRSQLQCTTCFKTFSRPYNLKSHQRTHTKERPFQCLHPECGWTFARPHDLKRHELLHSGVKPFACVCGKRFARSDAYKRHQSVDINCAISTMSQQRKRRPRSNNTTESTTL